MFLPRDEHDPNATGHIHEEHQPDDERMPVRPRVPLRPRLPVRPRLRVHEGGSGRYAPGVTRGGDRDAIGR